MTEEFSMNEMTLIWIAVAVVAIVLIAIAAWAMSRARRRAHLKKRFGPEYEHVVEERGDRTEAEAELAQREARVKEYEIRTLTAPERDRFAQSWRDVQARFVDDPRAAVSEADGLVTRLLETRGFPVGDFSRREADVSVRHPRVVHHYREAREIALRSRDGQATTEDLRQAMQHYRSLFDTLLTDRTAHPESEVA
jgi:FtsZ-interacting cell division protein ZipA